MFSSAAILGSTGSIGVNTLDVLEKLNIPIKALAAGKNVRAMELQVRRFKPVIAAMADEASAAELKSLVSDTETRVLAGKEGVLEAASCEAEICVNAIVGFAGLLPTIAAIGHSKRIALANKETLVCAGDIVLKKASESGSEIIPVDSEHSAIFQALQGSHRSEVLKILLTASGGPFFGKSREELSAVTVSEALDHPNWKMGAKITVDSSTMMNKGLEFIEAMRLFGVAPEQIEIIIHRESIIHSMVEFCDGSVIGQLGVADMRIPIQYAITYPQRIVSKVNKLDLFKIGKLTFFRPDFETFECIPLAIEAAKIGSGACTALNGANEVAVEYFLLGKLPFLGIAETVRSVLHSIHFGKNNSLEDIIEIDSAAREAARSYIERR